MPLYYVLKIMSVVFRCVHRLRQSGPGSLVVIVLYYDPARIVDLGIDYTTQAICVDIIIYTLVVNVFRND